MERNYQEDPGYKAAQKRVKDIKGFYVHLIVYLFVNVFLILANTEFTKFGNWNLEMSNFYTALFWGIGLAAHWAGVFGPGLFLGKNWEERKIKELMEKDREQMEKWE
ncbi:2TM domain-containing protein [Antarcticibacterium arcticum]|uniref:2TM domain-containing protein n=1 Tax=Antarcticibacterium arcticum TaxID=2585771 RepID=A0A5B8YLI7_9FLAO|nr:2TM domain-containing protein [Antarcticibacterium arcticum]QED37503.1 2TM domain-containing protein [Antarcticibacterium arcticum]